MGAQTVSSYIKCSCFFIFREIWAMRNPGIKRIPDQFQNLQIRNKFHRNLRKDQPCLLSITPSCTPPMLNPQTACLSPSRNTMPTICLLLLFHKIKHVKERSRFFIPKKQVTQAKKAFKLMFSRILSPFITHIIYEKNRQRKNFYQEKEGFTTIIFAICEPHTSVKIWNNCPYYKLHKTSPAGLQAVNK